jgi:hypothetical protein
MGTFGDRKFVDSFIAGNGRPVDDQEDAPDNPRAIKIVEYTTLEGATVWGVVFENEPEHMRDRYEQPTAFVNHPRVIWTLPAEVT